MTTKEDKQYFMTKVLRWLNKSDIFVSREMIARYTNLDISQVADCFEWLEQKQVIQFMRTSGNRAIYKTNKMCIKSMLEHIDV